MNNINLGFNLNDPVQKEAYVILKGMGRRKAAYISELVVNDDEKLTVKKVREVIREELSKINIESQKTTKKSQKNPQKKEANDNADDFLGSDEDTVNSLLSSMPGF